MTKKNIEELSDNELMELYRLVCTFILELDKEMGEEQMIEEYKKKIGVLKEVLEALPRNNVKNNKIYKDKVMELSNEYKGYRDIIGGEIAKRRDEYVNIGEDIEAINIKKLEDEAYKKIYLVNDFASSYEKSSLDRMLYKLSCFYNDELSDINRDIMCIIDVFKLVGVNITKGDFCFSYYSNLYMNKFLSVIDNDDRDSILKGYFEDIYWKCPDVISHITLNFKYLYYLNIDKFDNYYRGISSLDVKREYDNLYIKREEVSSKSRKFIINCFLNDIMDINDYSPDRVKKSYSYIFGDNSTNDVYMDALSFLHSILEYKGYLRFRYIILGIMDLYKDRDKYKGIYNAKRKEISKLENKVFKQNKKIFKLINRGKSGKIDYYNSLVNRDIGILNGLYDEASVNYFLEKVCLLNDDSTLYDILYLVSSNYNYLNILMKNNGISNENEYSELCEFVNYPYINILSNILINDERDIVTMIMDKYNLFGFELNRELFDDSNIDNVIFNIRVILNSIIMDNLGISYDKIKFVKASMNMDL